MKALLIMENMPKDCLHCPFYNGMGCMAAVYEKYYLGYAASPPHIDDDEIRQEWCPLKEMPKKLHVYDQTIFDYEDVGPEVRGWNRCIEEILK